MKKTVLPLLLIFLCSSIMIYAQGERAPSPSAKFVQKVGLTDVTIEYSRPGVKDRTIFADDGLVPLGKLWRTGANAVTKITLSDAIMIGDGELAAGSYALLTTPGADTWDVHFFSYDGSRWSGYRSADPAVTLKATAQSLSTKVESFLITVDNLRDYSANLVIAWDKTYVSLPFKVN